MSEPLLSWSDLAIIGHQKDFLALGTHPEINWEGSAKVVHTPFGSATFNLGQCCNRPFIFAPRYSADPRTGARVSPRAFVFALALEGVKRVLSLNGVGALSAHLKVNDFLVIDDFMEISSQVENSYYDHLPEPIFVRMNPALCPTLRNALFVIQVPTGVKIWPQGTYAAIRGPRYETNAEVRLLRKMGADVVGMRVATEASLCRELELCYASLCFVLDCAEGSLAVENSVSIEALKVGFNQALVNEVVVTLVVELIRMSPQLERRCECSNSLVDARRKGLVKGSGVDFLLSFRS